MTNKHVIEDTFFDIAFGSEDEAFEQQADLSSFVQDRLLRLVDEVFTDMSVADKVFRIDVLEIDLGTIPYHGFREEIERRLRERLTTILQDKLPSLPEARTPYALEGVITRQRLELEQLAYFLVSGRIPWHADHGTDQTIEQRLQRVMQLTGTQFRAWLQRLARRDTVIPRLVSQFPDDILRDIVGVLEPRGRDFITAVIERPTLFQHAVQEERYGPEHLKGQLWEFTLTYLLVQRGSQFNRRDFMGSLVRQMAAHTNQRYDDLLRSITSVLETSDTSHPLRRQLLQLLGELARERGDQSQEHDAARPSGLASLDIERLWARLAAALPHGAADSITDVWHTLVHEQPELLQGSLRYFGRQTEVRRRLARGFPETMLKDIVGVLEPRGRDFIIAVIERPVLFQHAEQGRRVEGLKGRLWEFTLTYLLVQRGSHFNQRDYMGSLMRQMAAHTNQHYDDLLRSITSVLETSETSHPLRRELLQLLGELAAERGEQPAAPEATDTRSAALLQADDLYEELRQRLLQETVPTNRLSQLIDALAKAHSEQLLRLFRELQAGDLPWAQAAATLSAQTLDRLIKAFLALPHQGGAEGRADLRRAIADYANRARDATRYYRQVLACLLQDQIIDLDAILAQNLAVDRAPSTGSATQNAAPKPEPPFPARSTDDHPPAVTTTLAQDLERGGPVLLHPEEEEPDLTEDIYIANAGLVLAAPYLPRLFDILDLTENTAFKEPPAAERAVHLLQFMVNGQTDAPEYQLVLNKLLCGVRTGKPIHRSIDITDRERETIEELIQGMIQHWKVIGNTSVAGLQESFLQREGRLQRRDDAWHLLVQPRAFDMLLDQLPWSFALIKHPWMERVVHVNWR